MTNNLTVDVVVRAARKVDQIQPIIPDQSQLTFFQLLLSCAQPEIRPCRSSSSIALRFAVVLSCFSKLQVEQNNWNHTPICGVIVFKLALRVCSYNWTTGPWDTGPRTLVRIAVTEHS